MRELYREFFYIPKHGKIREKVMLTRVVMTTLIMIACLVAMSLTAYAYFTAEDVVVPSNYIASAKYELDIKVLDGDTTVTLTDNKFTAEAGKEYAVSLTYVEGSAETGFCGVKIGNKIYHTEQLGKDKEAENEHRADTAFSVAIEGTGSITIELIPHWGTSSQYDLYRENGEAEELYITRGNSISLEIFDGVIPEIYVVQSGDSLWSIAQKFETTVEKLAAFNEISDTSSIDVNQTLLIPPSTWEIPETQTEVLDSDNKQSTSSETTGTSETTTTEPSSSTTETIPQTTQPAAIEPASTEATTETQPATENEETTGATTTEASE